MSTPTKAPAKKAAQKTPAEAAASEALTDGDVEIELRGEKFVITGESQRSFAVAMAYAGRNAAQLIFELISPQDHDRFIALGRGVDFGTAADEFFTAYNEASGQGNS